MKLGKKQIARLGAAVLALIGFFMMFVTPVVAKMYGIEVKSDFQDIFFPDGGTGVWTSFIAYLLVLGSAVGLAIAALVIKDAEKARKVVLGIAVALVLCAILIFLTKVFYVAFNKSRLGGMEKYLHLGVGSILGGIFSLLAGATAVVGEVLIKE